MVLAEIWMERRLRKARAEAFEQAREEILKEYKEKLRILQTRWEAWLQRWQDAQAAGIPFNEPPPHWTTYCNRHATQASADNANRRQSP